MKLVIFKPDIYIHKLLKPILNVYSQEFTCQYFTTIDH